MNLPGFFSGGGDDGDNRPSPRKELQLQGPRPTALKVNKDSHKIRKPPVAPPPHHLPPPPQPSENRQPIIIYAVPPRIIHTTVSDYKSLVQRLTGNNNGEGGAVASSSGVGDLSPAARLASIENTSPPKERELAAASGGADNGFGSLAMGDFLGDTNVEMGAVPGILSPAPWSLPPISPGFFSPAGDPFMMGLNMFVPSPSTLFTAPMVSPSPSSYDLLSPFFDF